MKSNITDQLQHIQQCIQAAQKQSLYTHDVTLLAVSKAHPAAAIKELYQANQRDFGENYVKEFTEKATQLADLDITWHYIGALQSNKTQAIAQHASWIHSIDRFKIAQRLSQQRPEHLPDLNICVQINFDHEPQKAGIAPEAAAELMTRLQTLPRLKLRGIMCIPKPEKNKESSLEKFGKIQQAFVQLCQQFPELDTLSMGMSHDLEEAIIQGSTMVRVGRALFGERPAKSHSSPL
tara:strand:+ start:4309 stop:5016 length:708 start_codon:yes stop_codon:yes gene_type:complete